MKPLLMKCNSAELEQREPEAFFDTGFPRGARQLWLQASLLGKTAGVSVQMIRDELGSEAGVVHDFGVLAMASASSPARHVPTRTVAERKAAIALYATNSPSFFRGDPAVCAELHAAITNSPSVTARLAAMAFLSWRPQPQDLPVFEWVASNDKFTSKPVDPYYFRMPGADQRLRGKKDAVIYPLRFLAEQAKRQVQSEKAQK